MRISQIYEFLDNLLKASELAVEIFIDIADLYNLDLHQVDLKELQPTFECLSDMQIVLPELGKFTADKKRGTVVFLDITKSTAYFEKKSTVYFEEKQNYTGFVIFNAYLLLANTIANLTNGEFIKYTGDGALLFYPDIKLPDIDKANHKNNPLWYLFLASEELKSVAKDKKLINYFSKKISSNIIKEYSLIHIGFSYGEILEIKLGKIKDLVAPTVWEAAKNCKDAPRETKYEIIQNEQEYKQLPIKG